VKSFVAAAGASPSLRIAELRSRLIAVRYPAANGSSRIFEDLHGLLSNATSKYGDSLMTRAFQAPGI